MANKLSLKLSLSLFTFFALAACGGGGGYGGGGGSSGGSTIITSIEITPGSSSLAVGKMQQYSATTMDSGGMTVTGATLTWASSDPSVAKVSGTGLATAVSAGSTTITASISYNSGGGLYSGGGNPITYTSNRATLSVSGSEMVMGTAAVGHALAGAMVTLKDAQGQSQTAMSDAGGRFQLSTAGLKGPYLLKAVDNQGRTLFSMSAAGGVANITPVTDLMARAWFAAHGGVDAAFADPASHPAPDAASLAQLDGRFTAALHDDIAGQGLDPQTFSFLSTPFTADGTGADHILDNLGVVMGGGQMLLQDRMAGQEIDVSRFMQEGAGSKQSSI